MSDEILSPLIGSALRVENRSQLEEFLTRPDAAHVVRNASFEEVFFTIKHVGLADSLDLLPLVSGKHVRGFIDLDCWRKDTFIRKPFMEWIAAFIQSGPEETMKAISGVDDNVTALFLKDLIKVYEVERDDPPTGTQLIFTPDNRFAVEPIEEDDPTSVGMLILDALFKYNPSLGSQTLTKVRYTTRTELEEVAYENKTRRLEMHGFVDYYDALSIYATPAADQSPAVRDREPQTEEIPGEENPGNLPAIFADSLMGGSFLMKAFEQITDPIESDRFAQELTALGNRILSANLVNLGELENVRPALEEMRDFLTIGLERLSGGRAELAPGALRQTYIQTIFRMGFDQVARLREEANGLARIRGFQVSTLDEPDREFVEALRRFKPLLIEEGQYRNFQSLADVERARARLEELARMVEIFVGAFSVIRDSLRKTFNTATVQFAISGRFEPVPIKAAELESFLANGFKLPAVDVQEPLRPFAERWLKDLKDELKPLVGKPIDPRFVGSIHVQ
ncbi:MAG: hypothetical protein DMG12_11645 [Acidobacteria bacterium]|nr:MAG: hypothetical protein DMG12_11645 [Acidobacteriota bacterium]